MSHPTRLLLAVLVASLALAACEFGKPKEEKKESKHDESETATLVRVENPHRGALTERIEITAKVEAYERADVFPKIEGTVVKVHVVEGAVVKAGDVLAELECEEETLAANLKQLAIEQCDISERQSNATLKELQAQQKGNDASFEKEEKNLERAKKQHAEAVITDAELEAAQNAYDLALANKEKLAFSIEKVHEDIAACKLRKKEAQAQLKQSQLQVEYAKVRATIDGKVTKRHIKLGQKASPSMAAYSLKDFDSLIIVPKVPQKEIRHLSKGQAVEIKSTAWPGKTFTGKVEFISDEVTADGGVETRIRVEKSNPTLLPGMFVSGHIVTNERANILLISKKSLMFDRDRAYVFVVEGKDGDELRVRKVYIQRGLEDNRAVEYVPTPGKPVEITDATRIVAVGMDRLVDGGLVTLEAAGDAARASDSSGSGTSGDSSSDG